MNDNEWYSQIEDLNSEDMQQRAEDLENIPNFQPDEEGLIEHPFSFSHFR